MFDHVEPVLLVEMEQDLGGRVRAKDVPSRAQLSSQLSIVIDLAVEGDDKGGVRGCGVQGHRLDAIGAEVDDREAATGQSQSPVTADPLSGGVRTTTEHGGRNAGKGLAIYRRCIWSVREICCDSTQYLPNGCPPNRRSRSGGSLVGETKLNSYQFV